MKRTVLCADIGTSSLKSALIDDSGSIRSFYRVHFTHELGKNMWLDAFKTSCRYHSHNAADCFIGAVSISGNGPTLVTANRIFLWNEKISNVEYKGPSLFLPRILYIKNNFPEEWNATSVLYTGPEYLVHQLTGSSAAVLPEQRYEDIYWSNDEIKANGLEYSKLPRFIYTGQTAGVLSRQDAARFGLKTINAVPVYCTGPDFISALIGTNTLESGRMCDRAGTSEGLSLCTSAPLKEPGIRSLPSIISSLYNASVLIPDSGSLFSTYKRASQYASKTNEECVRILKSEPDSEGGIIIYTILGNVRSAFVKLQNAAAQKGQIIPQRISATGGQVRNTEWMQMKSDVLGVPVEVTTCPDAELKGNFITAQTGCGYYASIQEGAQMLVETAAVFTPDSRKTNEYLDIISKISEPQT